MDLFSNTFNKCVKKGKASGADHISPDYLKEIGPEKSGLGTVIKSCLTNGKFPSQWKIAKVSCLFKKGAKTECDNYRPISLLSIPSKVLEGMITTQLKNHLNSNNLITPHQ